MKQSFKKIIALLLIAGGYASSLAFAQSHTGPVIVPRDRTSPSIHEGPSGIRSAGYKQDIKPEVGNLPASYEPFSGFGRAIGSLVLPFFHNAPSQFDSLSYGFKSATLGRLPNRYSQTGRTNRLDPGIKAIGGKNVTDVAAPGQVCGSGPGDLYWVGFPRRGNVEIPPPFQMPANSYDCFCRCNEKVLCPVGFIAKWMFYEGLSPGPVPCQVCFGAANIGFNAIVKHDIYVGQNHDVPNGYPADMPYDTGYQQCLRESVQSYAASGPGGSPTNQYYGL